MKQRLRELLYRIVFSLEGDRLEKYNQLQRWSVLDTEETTKLQHRRLHSLISHAYNNVPYYSKLFDKAGVSTGSSFDISQFNELPILTKEDIRANFEKLQSKDNYRRDTFVNTSGGSTGEPVKFIQDRQTKEWEQALKRLYDEWTGCRKCDPKVKLWGSEADILQGRRSIKGRVDRWLKNKTLLNSFRMTDQRMLDYVKRINTIEPVQILAYVESIYNLSLFIERRGLSVYSPDAIMTSAEPLHDPVRQKIKSVFNAPVFDRYGSREAGDIACECSAHDGLHISAPLHYVEILDEDGKNVDVGEAGYVVVTTMTNYSMPLIRYKIGDIAVKAKRGCSCGCGWPKLREIKGRISDTFIASDGTRVHGEYFTHLFYYRDWVERFQVIQETRDLINIKLVAKNPPTADIAEIKERIRKVMGSSCRIEFEVVDDISRSDSGKYRYTISKVSENQ